MQPSLKNISIFFHSLFLCISATVFTGCSEQKSPPEPYPIHAIRFTDNDFQYESPEEIVMSGQEQTVTLSIKSISIGPDSPITARPGKLMYNAKPIQEGQSYDFFDVKELQENGESVIKVSLKPNDTYEARGVSINIYCKLPGIENSLYGLVNIIQEPLENDTPLSLKIKYKGTYYSSDAHIASNGEYLYDDKDFMEVMNKIDADPSIQMLIMESGVVNYYDAEDINNNLPYDDFLSLNNADNSATLTRGNYGFEYYNQTDLGFFGIFEHKDFSGSKITQSFNSFDFTYDLPLLKNLGMNDKISSISLAYNGKNPLVCSVLTIWDDSDFNYGDDDRNKHRISIMASINTRTTTIADLKTVKKIGSSDSWNDCISSSSFHFGYVDRLLKDY